MDEMVLMMLVKQYADKFGITFSSKLLDDADKKAKLIKLMQQALAGQRGPVIDSDLET